MSKQQGVFLRQIASDTTEAVIDIVGVIGWEVGYEQLKTIIGSLPDSVNRVVFSIYSPGGDVWEGNAVISLLGELSKRVETVARVQVAASMATLIAVACSRREMAANGRWLIHNPWTQLAGDADNLEKRAKELRDTEIEAAKFYASRTGKSASEILSLMAEERWLVADEARDWGFVHAVSDPFAQADYAGVRSEMMTAGTFPQALAVITEDAVEVTEPPEVEPIKEESNDAEHTDGTEGDKPAAEGEQTELPASNEEQAAEQVEEQAEQVAALTGCVDFNEPIEPRHLVFLTTDGEEDKPKGQSEYSRGYADGEVTGRASATAEHAEQVASAALTVDKANRLASRLQGEKDRLQAALDKATKDFEARSENYQSKLQEATARLSKLLSGSLSFSQSIETWEEAMRITNGDYEQARAKYPDAYRSFMTRTRR